MTQDTPDGTRIAKVIARAGLASRRDAERLVEEGRVAVNGKAADSPALNVRDGDRVTVDGRPLPEAEGARLWLYHKPAGLVTTERDEKDRETVFDALRDRLGRVLSVGRLDLTSEGLLLLTNDGDLKRRLELPETGWLRRYRVRVNGSPAESALDRLRAGVEVDGERFAPMQVTLDRQQGANAWLTVGLREGRNREIRRAADAVGLAVNRLIRVSYGPFQLGRLEPDTVEEVKPRVLREQLGALFDGDFAEGRRDDAPRPPRHAGDRLMDKGRGKPGGKAPRGPGGKAGPGPRADRAGARPDKPRTGKPPVTRNDGDDVGGRARGPKPGGKPWKGKPRDGEGGRGGKPWETRDDGDRRRGDGEGRGWKDRPRRDEGDRPQRSGKPWQKRDGEDRARGDGEGRPWKDRPRRDEGDRPQRSGKPWEKRDGGDRARGEGGGRPWKDRPRRDEGDRPAHAGKPWAKRDSSDRPRGDGESRPWKDRPRRQDGDRPARGKPDGRRDGEGRGDRPWRDKPRRDDGPRGDGPRGGKPFRKRDDRPREDGERRPWKDRPRGDDGNRPRGDRPPRDGKPWETRDRPDRGDGPRKPGRGDGPKPRRDDRPERPQLTKAERKAAMRADSSVSLRKGGQRGRGISKPKPAGGKSYVKPPKPKA